MHMADALLSPAVGGAMMAASAASVVYSAVKIKKDELGEKKLPVMAVAALFVFAAQMVNFTIPAQVPAAISEAAYFWLPCWRFPAP